MVYSALADSDEELRSAPYKVLADWHEEHDGNLRIMLPDPPPPPLPLGVPVQDVDHEGLHRGRHVRRAHLGERRHRIHRRAGEVRQLPEPLRTARRRF